MDHAVVGWRILAGPCRYRGFYQQVVVFECSGIVGALTESTTEEGQLKMETGSPAETERDFSP